METQNETTEINSFASGGINRARHVNGLERRGAERQHDGQQNERPNAPGHDEETWHDEETQNDAKASAPDDEEAPDDENTGHDVDTGHDKKVRLKFRDNPYAQEFGAYFPMSKRRRASVADAWLALYGDYLYKYAMLRLRDATASEAVVQETLLAALRAYRGFAGRASERTWLVAILKHKMADHFRRAGREFPIGDESEDTSSREFFETANQSTGSWKPGYAPTDWHAKPLELIERKHFWQVFNECLSHLPQRTASAFTLREVDGLERQEICELLSVSMNNLGVMLHLARLHLRHCMELAWLERGRK